MTTDDAPLAGADRPEAEGMGDRHLVLTNRMNLNGILSSGIIGPRDSYAKYYQDPLELSGGRVAVLHAAPAADLVAYASAKVRTGPALLELAPGSLGELPIAEPATLIVALPLSAVIAIHLPDERSLREHLARRYNNIHPHDHLLTVSPELFDGSVTLDVLRGLPTLDGPESPTPQTWQLIDRIRGAMSASVLGADSEATLRAAQALMPGQVESSVLGDLLEDGEVRPTSGADERLAAACARTIARADLSAWDPVAMLGDLQLSVEQGSPQESVSGEIAANLSSVTAVVTGERPFSPFRGAGRGLRSAKALLLFLLRPELQGLLSWPRAETGADRETVQLAAVYAGLLRGLSRESVALRSAVLDDASATWACQRIAGVPSATTQLEEGSDGLRLTYRGDLIREVDRDARDPAEKFAELPADLQTALAPKIAKIIGATRSASIVVTAPTIEVTHGAASLVATFPAEAVVEQRYDLQVLTEELEEWSPSEQGALEELLEILASPARPVAMSFLQPQSVPDAVK